MLKFICIGVIFAAVICDVSLGSRLFSAGSCPTSLADVTSQCLAGYRNKVHHMQRDGQNFYTGIDFEEMRSICSAVQRGVRCITDGQRDCPHLEGEPSLPGDAVHVFHLCHTRNFYERYSISQNCYANVQSSTNRCYERFESRTRGQVPDSAYPSTVHSYCSHFQELVSCVWAIVMSNCGAQAAEMTDALVRPAVSHSATCLHADDTTTLRTTTVRATTSRLHRYHENRKNQAVVSRNDNQQTNAEQLGNTAVAITASRYSVYTLTVVMTTATALLRLLQR